MRAGNPTAEDCDISRRYAWHAAEQHAAPAVHLFETVRANLWCHAAGNLGHGREQRQRALWTRNCLISDGGDTRGHEIFGLRPIRREVEISEQDLPAAKLLALGRERLLDLYDHLGAGKHGVGVSYNLGPGLLIIRVRQARTDARPDFYNDLMSAGRKLTHG